MVTYMSVQLSTYANDSHSTAQAEYAQLCIGCQ